MGLLPTFPCDALPRSCLPLHSGALVEDVGVQKVEPSVELPVEPSVELPVEPSVEPSAEPSSVESPAEPSESIVEDDESHIIVGSVTPAYEQLTVKELRDLCRAKEISFDGKKAELLQRLYALR